MDTTEGTQEQVPLPLSTLLFWYYFTKVMISFLILSDLSFETTPFIKNLRYFDTSKYELS